MQNSESATQVSVLAPVAPALFSSRVRHLLRVLGPAWIVMLADVDAASVVTAAQAGSSFGYAMLLPIVALIPILYVIQEMTARLAIATGGGHAELIRDRFGVRWATVAVLTMVAIDMLAYVAEFAGIVLGASLLGISAPVAVVGALAIHSAMVLTASYRNFERMAVVLSFGLFAFVGLAFAARPDPGAVLGGLSPAQPFGRAGYLDLVVANIGAVIMPWMLFYQQAATVDKGLCQGDLKACRAETLIGSIASELLMAAIVIAAAAAVGPGHDIVAGGLALPAGLAALAHGPTGVLIAIGMIGSGLLAAIVISLSSAWAWGELFRWPHSLNHALRQAPAFYGLYLLEIVPAAIVALLAQNLVSVVIDAMVLNVVVLAIPLAFLIRLSGDTSMLGGLANSRRRTALLWVLTGSLLSLGLWSAGSVFGVGL